jgi:hypothetical protein
VGQEGFKQSLPAKIGTGRDQIDFLNHPNSLGRVCTNFFLGKKLFSREYQVEIL